MTSEQENLAIDACKTDLTKFNILYREYVGDVYRYAYSIVGNKNEAEEIVSETFLKALQSIKTYEYKGKPLKHWLFIIARNVIYQGYRKPENLEFDERWHGIEDDNILDLIADRDMVSKVEEFIRRFKPPVPEIIRLRIWEDMSFEEISDVVGKNLTTVKMAYYRALEKVREEFMKEGVTA